MDSEARMRQLVLWEMAQAIKEETPIRVQFSPGTDTHRQVSILCTQNNLKPREVLEVAVRSMFYTMLAGVEC